MYGIIGNPLEHSWSPAYFIKKFAESGIPESYKRFPLNDISELPQLLQSHPELNGLNVTIPFKESVIPFLDELSSDALYIQSVNCIQIIDGKTIGHNTDVIGFEISLHHFIPEDFNSGALVFGTGGASKSVAAVLKKRKINFHFVSRKKTSGALSYEEIDEGILHSHLLLINTTPLGMWPKILDAPTLPYELIGSEHFLFDLIYNPPETLFLKQGKQQGASIKNGEEMLIEQAEASWRIWKTKQ